MLWIMFGRFKSLHGVEVKEIVVTRPAGAGDSLNNRLFKAVLGGGPGSFGVITEITFNTIKSGDYPHCLSYSRARPFDRNVFKKVLEIMLNWTDGTLHHGLDIFVTIASDRRWHVGPSVDVLLFEFAYTGKTEPPKKAKDQLDKIIKAIDVAYDGASLWVRALDKVLHLVGHGLESRTLAEISHEGVRKAPFGVTADGREFKEPYVKRVNMWTKKFSENDARSFADKVATICQDTIDNGHFKVIVQMLIGGGESANPEKAATFRDLTFGFVFDIFCNKVL
jgi:hypothetical protein